MKEEIRDNELNMKEWMSHNYSPEQVTNELINAGLKDEEIQKLLNEYKKYQSEHRQKMGFIYMSCGAIIGFLSCVLAMLDLIPSLTGFILYGLTTIAILVVLYGCYLVFE